MRRTITAIVALLPLALQAQATYKVEKVGGKYLCQGTCTCSHDDKTTFASALLWAYRQGDDSEESSILESHDAGKLVLNLKPTISASADAKQSYSFSLAMQVKGGEIAFLAEKIKCIPNNIIGTLTAVNFDKINLEKKPQQQEYIDEFETLCNDYLAAMFTAINGSDVRIGNWEAIAAGTATKGMTADECLLAIGKPNQMTRNSQREQWMYDGGLIVVFEDGVVTAVVK